MSSILRTLLPTIDLLGIPIVLTLFGKEKLKSPFGGFCSLLFLGFIIFAFINAGDEMFHRTNPKSVSSARFNDNPRDMILSSANFPVAFGLQTLNNGVYEYFIDETVYIMTGTVESVKTMNNPDGTVSRESISLEVALERCTESHFGELAFAFTRLDLKNLYCIAKTQSEITEIRLQGAFTTSTITTLNVKAYECNSATSSGICANENVRRSYLEASYFNFIYANMVIDPSNYTYPDTRFQDIYYKSLSRTLSKTITVPLSHVKVITDSGWLDSELSEKNYVMVDKFLDNSVSRNLTTDLLMPLASAYYQVSKLEMTYTRSYKKVLTVLAEVASLASTVLMVLVVLVGPYLRIRLRENIMGQLFDIDTEIGLREKKDKGSRRKKTEIRAPNSEKKGLKKEKDSSQVERDSPEVEMVVDNQDKQPLQLPNSLTISAERMQRQRDDKEEEPASTKTKESFTKMGGHGTPLEKLDEKIGQKFEGFTPRDETKNENENNEVRLDIQQNGKVLSENELGIKTESNELRTLVSKKQASIKLEVKVLEEPEDENFETSDLMKVQASAFYTIEENAKENELKGGNINSAQNRNSHNTRIPSFRRRIENFEAKTNEESPKLKVQEKENGQMSYQLSLWEYIQSFVYKTKDLQAKMRVLEMGASDVNERLDVVNLLKKLREIDKIKALLFDKDQLVVFNSLPKPEISSNKRRKKLYQTSFPYQILKKSKFLDRIAPEAQLMESYEKIKHKEWKTFIDERLVQILSEAND